MRKILFIAALLLTLAPLSASAATLTSGSTGSGVVALQQALIAKGYLAAGKATGTFGPLTLAALKKFQCDQGIVCSGASFGMYGPRTAVALGGTSGGVTSSNTTLEYSGWLPYWREASSTIDALQHLDQLKEINPFVYVLQKDGTIQDMAGIADEPWASLIAAAKAKKVRVVPTIMSSDTNGLHTLLSNSASRVQLESDIAALVVREGFDGIDIDFEGKQASDENNFSTFLKGLYSRMGSKWVMCTIESRTPISDRYYGTTVPVDAGQYANDFVAMNKYCDRVRFMTYDQQTIDLKLAAAADANHQLYAPVADTAWVETAIKEALKTIAPGKIVMGVATYGYEWDVTAYADGYQYKLLWSFGPNYATAIAAQHSLIPTRQASGEMGFSYDPTSAVDYSQSSMHAVIPGSGPDVFASATSGEAVATSALSSAQANNTHSSFRYMVWQDAQAIADKVALAKKLGIKGVAIFRLDGGEDPGMWAALK